MTSRRIKRSPDTGVGAAVASVNQHQSFKRMLMFALRSLSEFCSETTMLYKENATDALNRGVLPSMTNALNSFPDDEDLRACIARVVCAMAIAAKEENDAAILQKLVDDGGPNLITLIVNAAPSDAETIENCMIFIENVSSMGVIMDGTALAPGLVAIMSKAKFSPKTAKRVIAALAIVAAAPDSAAAIYNAGGAAAVLQFCITNGDLGEDSVAMVESAFDMSKHLAQNGMSDSLTLNQCIELMDKYKTKKSASAKGSAALAAMVGPDQLRSCLKTLKSAAPGTTEHDEALTMLSSMSYISSYTDEIVKAGGIPMLISLINNGLSQLETNPEKIYRVICGASRMLSRIASNPANVDAIAQSDAVQSLCVALSYCTENNEAIGALCLALVPLAIRESYAKEMIEFQAFATLLPLLYNNANNKELAAPAMELVATGSQHPELHSHMIDHHAVEFCATCCQYHTDDASYELNAVNALNRLSSNLSSVAEVYQFGGLGGLTSALKANANNEEVALVVVQLCEKLSRVPDATTYMCDGAMVDSILQAMLEHESNEALVSAGINTLSVIATEEDCNRHMEGLSRAIQTASNDPDRVYKTLAAICGLSKVPHLRPIIEAKNASSTVLQGVQNWIEGPKFEGQGKIIQAGLKTAKALKLNSIGDLTSVIVMIIDTTCLPQVKRIVELQEPDDNVLVNCMSCVCELAAAERVSGEENIKQCIEGILKVMKKYPDSRKTQVLCLDALNYFALADNGLGVKLLVETNAIKAVINYLNKAPMYLDAQIAGFTVLASCAKVDPETADVMRKFNCLQALQTAMRTHSKSKQLKRTIAPLLALLMPTDALEREIREQLKNIEESMQTNNYPRLHESLGALNELLVTAEGSKIGARCGVPQAMAEVQPYIASKRTEIEAVSQEDLNGKDFHDGIVFEVANAITQIAQTRVGRVNCTKANNVATLIDLYESIKPPPTNINEEAAVRTLEGLRLLMKHDKGNADIAFQRQFVRVLCNAMQHFPESNAVLTNACGCLAAMANSPDKVNKLIQEPDFNKLLERLNDIIENSPKKESKEKAIEALQDLLQSNDENMAKAIANSGSVHSLMKVLHENPEDPELTRQAARALAMIGNFEDLRRFWDGDVREPAGTVARALSINKNNADASVALLDVMNKLTNADDRNMLREAGALETIAEVMVIHYDNPEVIRLGGELFAKMGADEQIKALMQQIIQTVNSGAPDTILKVDNLSAKLAMFLAAPLENPADALQYTEQCLASLNQCLASAPDDARLHGNVAAVSRRLCDRCFDDSEDPYGAWAVTSSGMLNQFAEMINSKAVDKNKKFLIPAYRTLAATAANPYSNPTLQGLADTILPNTYELLNLHQNDPEVVARILEFLRFMSEDPEGAKSVMAMTGAHGDIVEFALKLMNQHKKSDPVCIAGMGLLGALAANCADNPHPLFTNGTALKECEGLCAQAPSDMRQLAYMGMVEKFLGAQIYNDAIKHEGCIDKAIARVKLEEEEKRMSDADRAGLYAGLARMLQAAAESGMLDNAQRTKGFEALIRAIEDYPDDPRVIRDVNRALKALALSNQDMAVRVIKEAVPKLATEASATIQTDPECADTYLDLLSALTQTPGNGRQLTGVNGIEETMEGIVNLGNYYGDDYGNMLKDKVATVRQAMLDDQPREKTCKDVYQVIQARLDNEETIAIPEAAALLEELDFLFSQMGQYNQERLNHETSMGADHQWGNMAFELLCNEARNVPDITQNDFVKLELACIKNQPDEKVVHNAVRALAAYAKHSNAAQEAAKTSGSAAIVAEALSGMQKNSKFSNEEREEQLISRALLVERVAINRNLFNKTNVMTALLACWDDFDKNMYSTTLLRQVFRAMRRVVSDAHVAELLRANALERLIGIINDHNADVGLLPDVLFLLGSLAVVPEIKTKIGEIGGIDACVELLRRMVADKGSTAVVTNCCLALANICIGHKKNAAIFFKLKGPDLNAEVLEKRANEYDVANGSSVLLCNVLYKNEQAKKHYGQNGSPRALSLALSFYDGSEEKNAIRCLQSLFKAISNMSLYTLNVPPFLEARVQDSYVKWLVHLKPTFPAPVLETGLRTLSNLVVENEEKNMENFGVVLVPCLDILKQGREEPKVLLLLLDVIFNLCRLRKNAEMFADNDGIQTVSDLLVRCQDVSVLTASIRVLGIQSNIPDSLPKLENAGIFSLLAGCLELDIDDPEVTELQVATLRCTRRLIQSQHLALGFVGSYGTAHLAKLLAKSMMQPMVVLEACRVFLCLLHYTGGEQVEAGANHDDYMGDVGDEKGDGSAPTINPPAVSHGGWKRLGLDEGAFQLILMSLCASMVQEAHLKQLRLQRVALGVCTYFAAEHVCTECLVTNDFSDAMSKALTNFPGDPGIAQTACIAINNIAMTSGDLYEATARPELISSLNTSYGKLAGKKPEEKQIRTMVNSTYKAMTSGQDPFEAFAELPMEYDLGLTEWSVDPYPNGVQDLPANVKDALRKGGKAKVFIGEKDREEMKWRSSQDLNVFEWCVGAETEWNNRVPIVRIRNVSKALTHPALVRANKKEPRKVTNKVCLCIYGPPTEDTPDGIELPIKMKTQKERDGFVEMFVMWRDAATYTC